MTAIKKYAYVFRDLLGGMDRHSVDHGSDPNSREFYHPVKTQDHEEEI